MNGLAVIAVADVLRYRVASQLHLDETATTSNMGDGHYVVRGFCAPKDKAERRAVVTTAIEANLFYSLFPP
jgi:hypothetical protein